MSSIDEYPLRKVKGPVKVIDWVKIPFICTCYVETVPTYDCKLVWIVLHLSVKDFSK